VPHCWHSSALTYTLLSVAAGNAYCYAVDASSMRRSRADALAFCATDGAHGLAHVSSAAVDADLRGELKTTRHIVELSRLDRRRLCGPGVRR